MSMVTMVNRQDTKQRDSISWYKQTDTHSPKRMIAKCGDNVGENITIHLISYCAVCTRPPPSLVHHYRAT